MSLPCDHCSKESKLLFRVNKDEKLGVWVCAVCLTTAGTKWQLHAGDTVVTLVEDDRGMARIERTKLAASDLPPPEKS
jgi:hypothetical protein